MSALSVKDTLRYIADLRNTELFLVLKWNIVTRQLPSKRRIKSHLPFAGIIRSSPYSPR